MKVQTKKVIAKEFLYLLLVIALGLVCFLSTYLYNLYLNNQDGNLDKIIVQKEKLADSLKNLLNVKNDPFKKYGGYEIIPTKKISINQFAEKIKEKYPEYFKIDDRILVEKVIAKYPVYLASVDITGLKGISDSVDGLPILKKKKSSRENWDNYMEIKLSSNDSLGFPPPFKTWKQSEKIKSELIKANFEKLQIETKVLSFKDQVALGCKALIFFFIMLFGVRYLYYAAKWSIITLKQNEP
jgi:hypothetical protein